MRVSHKLTSSSIHLDPYLRNIHSFIINTCENIRNLILVNISKGEIFTITDFLRQQSSFYNKVNKNIQVMIVTMMMQIYIIIIIIMIYLIQMRVTQIIVIVVLLNLIVQLINLILLLILIIIIMVVVVVVVVVVMDHVMIRMKVILYFMILKQLHILQPIYILLRYHWLV